MLTVQAVLTLPPIFEIRERALDFGSHRGLARHQKRRDTRIREAYKRRG